MPHPQAIFNRLSGRNLWRGLAALACVVVACAAAYGQPSEDAPSSRPAPPTSLSATDHPVDRGDAIDLLIGLSPDTVPAAGEEPQEESAVEERRQEPRTTPGTYIVGRSLEYGGLYDEVARTAATPEDIEHGSMLLTVDKCPPGQPCYFRVWYESGEGVRSDFVETREGVVPIESYFAGDRRGLAINVFVLCTSVLAFVAVARTGRQLYIRKIAGLEAVDEAVGRATEMGRPCLFVPGINDMNEIQTIAGITILSRVAKTAAEYDAKVEVPTSRALVMTAARETMQAAYLSAGRPEAYNEENVYYVTDEQFGYVAHLSGLMVREKPAACFYLGAFFAESLILAETGNSVGAIQVAGTAQPAQLPFFVAACDYTLIGEELFAASAYLSGEPDQLGSLKGQDVGKAIAVLLILIGCTAVTLAAIFELSGSDSIAEQFADFALLIEQYLLGTE